MARLQRREFLGALVVVAGPPFLSACGDGESTNRPDASPERLFPQSVASGDPRSTSVVLWTRAADPDAPNDDVTLVLEVATDSGFAHRVPLQSDPSVAGTPSLFVVALADAGGCVKVRVDGLTPSTTYYYRFTAQLAAGNVSSRTGRTRTAPDPASEKPVKFAVVSCQDYGGKYFHAYRHLAEQELDFVLHLGDYIYETTGDPTFQTSTAERTVTFSAPDEAIPLAGGSFLAARSLGNYRDLYRTYRSDPDLQRAHELFPLVSIPDDHEFSNDCHGATATYTDGREDETDVARRFAADSAWFEYTPVDYTAPPSVPLTDATFPDNFRVYRSFQFGALLELVLTDLRRYRPDHLVPEDAFPGSVFLTEAEAKRLLGEVPDDAVRYVDVDADEHAELRAALRDAAAAQGFDAERVTGLLSVPWINGVMTTAGAEAPLDPDDADFDRGYAYHQLLKSGEFAAQGARYVVAERPFRALATQRADATNGESERLMGTEQRAWFLDTLHASTRTWKVWGNEFALMQKVIDLTELTIVPPEFRQRVIVNADDWDGAPNERDALLNELSDVDNVVVVTGDLHAFFAGTPAATGKPETAVIELIAGSISSTTWQDGMRAALAADPSLPPGAELLAGIVGVLLTDRRMGVNPHIAWSDLTRNGYGVVSVEADSLLLTAYTVDSYDVARPLAVLPEPFESLFWADEFRVVSGSRTLEKKSGLEWQAWDPAQMLWV